MLKETLSAFVPQNGPLQKTHTFMFGFWEYNFGSAKYLMNMFWKTSSSKISIFEVD